MMVSLGLTLTPHIKIAMIWTTIPNQANFGWICPSCHIRDKMRIQVWRRRWDTLSSQLLLYFTFTQLRRCVPNRSSLKNLFFLYVNNELILYLPNPNQFKALHGVLFVFVFIFLRYLVMFRFTAKCTQSAQYQQCQVILQASLQDVSTAVAQWASLHDITGQMGQSSGLQALLSLK